MEKYGKLPVTPYLEHRENDKAHGAYVFFFVSLVAYVLCVELQ